MRKSNPRLAGSQEKKDALPFIQHRRVLSKPVRQSGGTFLLLPLKTEDDE